jgi:hypothetical protein
MEIIISSKEVLDYIVLNRRKNELEFKKNFLICKGAKNDDPHIGALNTTISNIEQSVEPLEQKMSMVGLTTLTFDKQSLERLNNKINKYSVEEVVEAATSKHGTLYDIMKKRGEIAKKNFEFKEELAALTVILTMIPMIESREFTKIIEGKKDNIKVNLGEEMKNRITPIIERLGYSVTSDANEVTVEKDVTELVPKWINNKKVWIEPENIGNFQKNEDRISSIMKKMQLYTAKSQINEMNQNEQKEFENLQHEYVKRIKKRESLCFYAHTDVKSQVRISENRR